MPGTALLDTRPILAIFGAIAAYTGAED